jgi:hypothetical protein
VLLPRDTTAAHLRGTRAQPHERGHFGVACAQRPDVGNGQILVDDAAKSDGEKDDDATSGRACGAARQGTKGSTCDAAPP